MKASGFSSKQLLKPYYQILAWVMGFVFLLNFFIVPFGLYLQQLQLNSLKDEAIRGKLVTQRFFTPQQNLNFYIGNIDYKTGEVFDIYIADYRTQPATFLTAKQGQFFQTQAGLKIKLSRGILSLFGKRGCGWRG